MIEFPCGCKFEENEKGRPIFDPNIYSIPLDCEATWDMISSGNTKGVFQLDSQLGQGKAAEIKPRNIAELSDLISVIRPGTANAMLDGKSLTKHYIDRKAGRDEVKYFHPALEGVLKSTYGILVYQEQTLRIARDIAGYSLQEAELLRKALGKKKIELMAEIEETFIARCIAKGIVSENDAKEIFGWIKEGQNYLFNKSHGISYAYNAYQTAYTKAHFPRAFLTSWLRHADGKIKPLLEVNELINNARFMDIEVLPPCILNMNLAFSLVDEKPAFGLTSIKNVGEIVYQKIKGVVKDNGYHLSDMGWGEFLMRIGRFIRTDSFTNLISAGALDCFSVSRNRMLYDFGMYRDLRDPHKDFLVEDDSLTFTDGLKNLISYLENLEDRNAHTDRYIEEAKGYIVAINSPPYSLVDMPAWKGKLEKELLGIEMTGCELDEYDTGQANCTCLEYVKGFDAKNIRIAAQITDVREWKIKAGKNKGNAMGFLKIDDMTCSMDNITIFSQEWEKCKKEAIEGAVVILRGSKDKNRGDFLVKGVQKLKRCV